MTVPECPGTGVRGLVAVDVVGIQRGEVLDCRPAMGAPPGAIDGEAHGCRRREAAGGGSDVDTTCCDTEFQYLS